MRVIRHQPGEGSRCDRHPVIGAFAGNDLEFFRTANGVEMIAQQFDQRIVGIRA